MRVPRDVPPEDLIRVLKRKGYYFVRQKGSHARYRHDGPPQHNLTIPMHQVIEVRTLEGILKDLSEHLKTSVDQLVREL